MSVTTRNAKFEDLEALYAIETECFTLEAFSKRQIASLLQNPNSVSLLAQMNGEIAGFIIALIHQRKSEKTGRIYTLDVAVKARKKGVGLKLVEHAEQILRKKGVKTCHLEVRIDNIAARELYKKLGYVETELLKGFYPEGDGVKMKKILQ